MSVPAQLQRRLGLGDAVTLGLGSMVGAGIFAVFGPATRVASSAVLPALVLAAAVAFANATSSAQLAAARPTSGGAYVHGRERLGEWWGFLAGWGFVAGKTASCAAMALTLGAYLWPGHEKVLGVAAVAGLALVERRGITRTASATRVVLTVALVALGVAVVVGWSSGAADAARLVPRGASPYEVLQAAGLLFFAFAGYARIATLGEEVRDPARTIPRAVVLALGGAVVLYAVVGVTLLAVLGPERLGASAAPVVDLVGGGSGGSDGAMGWTGAGWAVTAVRIGAAAAAAGALLALLTGIGRTGLAMARHGDLPRPLAAVHPRFATPHRAQATVAVTVVLLVVATDLRTAIGFSSFGVLLYYLVANLSALRQPPAERRYPRALAVGGAVGCAALVVTVPPASVATGVVVLAVGVAGRLAAHRHWTP